MTVGFVFALESEFDVFKRHYPGSFHFEDPFYISEGGRFKVIISGVGKTLAALATQQLINRAHPDVIVISAWPEVSTPLRARWSSRTKCCFMMWM